MGLASGVLGFLAGNIGFTPYRKRLVAFYNSFDIYQIQKRLLRIVLAK